MKPISHRLLPVICILGFLLPGCPQKAPVEADTCLTVTEMMTTEVSTAGVRTLFQVSDCDGNPVPDLTGRQVTILLDGKPMQSEGNVSAVLNQDVAFELNTLVLLDVSDSIVANGHMQGMIAAAKTLVATLISQGHNVAIYRFAGPAWFGAAADFTNDLATLNGALDTIAVSEGLGTTDLYGSIARAVDILTAEKPIGILSEETLVLFTDGTDEAMVSTRSAASTVIAASGHNVFTVGLGSDINQEELQEFGTGGFEWAENTAALGASFARITAGIQNRSKSYYLMGICSPRAGGIRSLEIQVRYHGESGSLKTRYDATGFDIVGCDPQQVAYPCMGQQCGVVDGFVCGVCGDGLYCGEAGVCTAACESTWECGISNGVSCGSCDQGPTFTCNNHLCEDACQNRQCGLFSGVDCGDCSAYGSGYGCSAEGSCEDACGEAQCGTINGVNCGDCGILGDSFGCSSEHVCVDVCEDYQCGVVSGVDCGGCQGGMACNGDHECVPIIDEISDWVRVPGGEVTLGCNLSLDSECGDDEGRVAVVLSDFYIMDSEATAGQYAQCVLSGECRATDVATTTGCTYTGDVNASTPINCITFEGMGRLCEWLGGTLPTEAQWEHAARSAQDGASDAYLLYPWGNGASADCTRVVMNKPSPGCGTGRVHEVKSLQQSALGLFDMAGNVAEWTMDWYGEGLGACGETTCTDPRGPASGDEKVIRGGSYNSMYGSSFRNAAREKESPLTTSSAIGGRCVLPVSK